MMYQWPVRIPKNRSILITQGYKSKELADFYRSKGIQMDEHNAIDFVTGTAIETYGTPVVAPVDGCTLLRHSFGTPVGTERTNNNFIQVGWTLPDGTKHEYGMLHVSEIAGTDGQTFAKGEVIAYMGNAGTITPAPTTTSPYNGAHGHFAFYVNQMLANPLDYFDQQNPFRGDDSGIEKDLPPLFWSVANLQKMLQNILGK